MLQVSKLHHVVTENCEVLGKYEDNLVVKLHICSRICRNFQLFLKKKCLQLASVKKVLQQTFGILKISTYNYGKTAGFRKNRTVTSCLGHKFAPEHVKKN